MTSDAEKILELLDSQLPRYLRELEELCAMECPTDFKAGVDIAGEWVGRWVAQRGWDMRIFPDDTVGNSLLITCKGGNPEGPRLLLAAHLDTVYPIGVAASRPLRVEGDRLLAPGAADNKSGLLSALYAISALEDLRLLIGCAEIGLLCGGDEETDMRASGAMLTAQRRHFDAALVLEAGRENGDIVASRKGRGHFTLSVTGKAAHAGVEPHLGANAILALSQKVVALHLLNAVRPSITVSVGVVSGGTAANVVPGHASAEVDVRITSPDDRAIVDEALAGIVSAIHLPGTTCTLDGAWIAPPMPRTPGGDALVSLALQCAGELGIVAGAAATGGMSYANLLADLGMPVIDGLGPVGGLDHSPDEYILVSSIVPRTALLALLLRRLA